MKLQSRFILALLLVTAQVHSSVLMTNTGAPYGFGAKGSMATGDFDGDGITDYAFGASDETNNGNSNAGAVYLVFGKTSLADKSFTGTSFNGGIRIGGAAASANFGSSVVFADIDGDGKDELIIGAKGEHNIYIIFGSDSLSSGFDVSSSFSQGIQIAGASDIYSNKSFGNALASADVDGDGLDDVLIAASEQNGLYGICYLIFGSSTLKTSPPTLSDSGFTGGVVLKGVTNTQGHFGTAVASAGDVDGDGKPDLIIGAPQENSRKGAAYVILTGTSTLLTKSGIIAVNQNSPVTGVARITSDTYNYNNLGDSVASLGDLDNDGKAEVILGASMEERAYLIWSSVLTSGNTVTVSQSTQISGVTRIYSSSNVGLGSAVASVGNSTVDKKADFLIGATTGNGAVYLISGSKDLTADFDVYTAATGVTKIAGDGTYNYFGSGLASGTSAVIVSYSSAAKIYNCAASQYVDQLTTCVDCSTITSGCASCSNGKNCYTCSSGYKISGNTCVEDPTTPGADPSNSSHHLSGGQIAGIVIGSVAFFGVMVGGAHFLWKLKLKKAKGKSAYTQKDGASTGKPHQALPTVQTEEAAIVTQP